MSNSKSMRNRAVTAMGALALIGTASAGVASTASAATSSNASTILAKIKYCESGGNYQAVNASSGASGAYQFLNSSWKAMGSITAGYPTAASAPASVQDAAALALYNQMGTSPWISSSSCWSTMTTVPSTPTASKAVANTAATPATKAAATKSTATKSAPTAPKAKQPAATTLTGSARTVPAAPAHPATLAHPAVPSAQQNPKAASKRIAPRPAPAFKKTDVQTISSVKLQHGKHAAKPKCEHGKLKRHLNEWVKRGHRHEARLGFSASFGRVA